MSHQSHKMMRRLSVLDGSTLAHSALTGATYHLDQINQLLKTATEAIKDWTGNEHPPFMNQDQINQIHWHLRSFFWELVGVFDLMLQWANESFQLGLDEHRVTWSTLPEQSGINQDVWTRLRSVLSDAWESEWYFEVRTYRNFAHRSFLHLTAIVPKRGNPELMLEHAREGQVYYEDVRKHLPKYLDAMRRLGEEVFAKRTTDKKNITNVI